MEELFAKIGERVRSLTSTLLFFYMIFLFTSLFSEKYDGERRRKRWRSKWRERQRNKSRWNGKGKRSFFRWREGTGWTRS
jgi:hypothetical protein